LETFRVQINVLWGGGLMSKETKVTSKKRWRSCEWLSMKIKSQIMPSIFYYSMGLKRSLFDLDLSHASLTQHQLIMIKSMIIVSSSWIGCSNYVHSSPKNQSFKNKIEKVSHSFYIPSCLNPEFRVLIESLLDFYRLTGLIF
jgi:hypothetical protein